MAAAGSFGWVGVGKRALEFPDGAMLSGGVGRSPPGRMRMRYNGQLDRAEISLNGAAYLPIPLGSSSTCWQSDAAAPNNICRLVDITDVVVIGATTPDSTEKLKVVGDSLVRAGDMLVEMDGATRELRMVPKTVVGTGELFIVRGQNTLLASRGGALRLCSGEDAGGTVFGAIELFTGNSALVDFSRGGGLGFMGIGAGVTTFTIVANNAPGQNITIACDDGIIELDPSLGAIFFDGAIRNARTVVAVTPYPVVGDDNILAVDTSALAITINLPSAAANPGRRLIIKDETGDAATRNITIMPDAGDTFDGAASDTIGVNRGSRTFYSDGGTDWKLTATT